MTAHPAVGPLHPYVKRLDFLCSKAMQEGWGQEKEDRNSLKIPGLPSIQKPFIPPSLQGSAGPPEMSFDCGSQASALQAGWDFWVSQFK